SVHICQTTSTGASNVRSSTTASWVASESVVAIAGPFCRTERVDVRGQAVEARLPHRPVLLRPRRHVPQPRRTERARAVLRASTTDDQPGALQYLDVLRHGGEGQVERLGELVHGRRTVGQAGENRPARGTGQRRKGLVQPVVVGCRRHLTLYFP